MYRATKVETAERIEYAFFDMSQMLSFVAWNVQKGDQRDVVFVDGSYVQAWYFLAYVLIEQKEYKKALEALQKALALEPDNPTVLCEEATLLGVMDQKELALQVFDSALTLRPWATGVGRGRALRGKGVLLVEFDRLDEAEAALLESLKYDPDHPLALNELEYIKQLRQGMAPVPYQPVPVQY